MSLSQVTGSRVLEGSPPFFATQRSKPRVRGAEDRCSCPRTLRQRTYFSEYAAKINQDTTTDVNVFFEVRLMNSLEAIPAALGCIRFKLS